MLLGLNLAEGRRAAQEDGAGSTGDEGDEPSAFDAEGYAALKTKRTAEVLQSGDDDDDEGSLLDWSEHLDFESYVENWTSVACTLGSEAYAPLPDGPQLAASMPRPGAVASKQVQDRLYAQAGGTLPRPFIGGATASSSVTTYALQ